MLNRYCVLEEIEGCVNEIILGGCGVFLLFPSLSRQSSALFSEDLN